LNENLCGDDNLLLYYLVQFDVLVEINPSRSTKGEDGEDPEAKENVVIDERRKEMPF